jgi:hypothetical protein
VVSKLGSTFSGAIDPGDDTDFYRFVAPATGKLIIRAKAVDELDPTLAVFNGAGVRLQFNDDANYLTYDSRVRLDAVKGRTYYVAVGSYRDSSGDFNLVFQATVAPRARRADLARFVQPAQKDDGASRASHPLPKRPPGPAAWAPPVAVKRAAGPRLEGLHHNRVAELFLGDWREW